MYLSCAEVKHHACADLQIVLVIIHSVAEGGEIVVCFKGTQHEPLIQRLIDSAADLGRKRIRTNLPAGHSQRQRITGMRSA